MAAIVLRSFVAMAARSREATCLCFLFLYAVGSVVRAVDTNHQSEARHHLESFFCTVDSDGDGEIEHHEASQFLKSVTGDHIGGRHSSLGLSSDDLGLADDLGLDHEEKLQSVKPGGFQPDSSNIKFNYGGNAISHDEFKSYLRDMLTAKHVADWVAHGLGLPQYADAFREKAIDGLMFPFLWKDPKVMQDELGVTSVLHAKRITVGIMMLMLGVGEAPDPPANFRSEPGRCGGIMLRWNRPENAGTPRVHKYVLEKFNHHRLVWEFVSAVFDQESEMAVLDENVHTGAAYNYRVQAWGAYGPSEHACVSGYSSPDQPAETVNTEKPIPPRPGTAGLIGSLNVRIGDFLRSFGCILSFALMHFLGEGMRWLAWTFWMLQMTILLPWASRHLWTNMGSAFPTALMSLFATPHSPVESQEHGGDCRGSSDNVDSNAISTPAREVMMPGLTSAEAPLALLNRSQTWAAERIESGNDPAVQMLASTSYPNHHEDGRGGTCVSKPLADGGHVDLVDAASINDGVIPAEASRMPRKGLKKSCNADDCSVRFDWFYWKPRHFCKRCQGVFCQNHTKFADHNGWWTTCKLETQCICNSCFSKEPSPVQARLAVENKLWKGEMRPSPARKSRKERPDVLGRKVSGRDPLTPCTLNNRISLKRIDSKCSPGHGSEEQENVWRMENPSLLSGNNSVQSIKGHTSNALTIRIVRGSSSPLAAPCRPGIGRVADGEQGNLVVSVNRTDEQSGARRSGGQELDACYRGSGLTSGSLTETGNDIRCIGFTRECVTECSHAHKTLRSAEAKGVPGKPGHRASDSNGLAAHTGRAERTIPACRHTPSSSANPPLLLLPAPASTSSSPSHAVGNGPRVKGMVGGMRRANGIRDLAGAVKSIEEAGPEMQDGSLSSAKGGSLPNARSSGNSGIVGMSLEVAKGFEAPNKTDGVRDSPLRKGADLQHGGGIAMSADGSATSSGKAPTHSKWKIVKQLMISSSVRQRSGNSSSVCQNARNPAGESSSSGPPSRGDSRVGLVTECDSVCGGVNMEERQHTAFPSPDRESGVAAMSSLNATGSASPLPVASESSANPTTTEEDECQTSQSSCCSEIERCNGIVDEGPSMMTPGISKRRTGLQANGQEAQDKWEKDEEKEKGEKFEASNASCPLKRKVGLFKRTLSGRLELMLQGGNHYSDSKGNSGHGHCSSSGEVHSKSEGGLNFLSAAKKARRRWRLAGICVIFSRRSRPRSPSPQDNNRRNARGDSESLVPMIGMTRAESFGDHWGKSGEADIAYERHYDDEINKTTGEFMMHR